MIALGESDISMENGADYYHYHLSPARIEVKLQGPKEDLDTFKGHRSEGGHQPVRHAAGNP